MQAWPASCHKRAPIYAAEQELTHFQPPAQESTGKTRWVAENIH